MKTLTEVIAKIVRDPMMKPSTTVYEWELPILAELHGEDAVVEVERYQVRMPENFTPADEYERLRAKYERRLKPNQPSPLQAVWGKNARALADHLSMAMGAAEKRFAEASVQKNHNPRKIEDAEPVVVKKVQPVATEGVREPQRVKSEPAPEAKPVVKKKGKAGAKAK